MKILQMPDYCQGNHSEAGLPNHVVLAELAVSFGNIGFKFLHCAALASNQPQLTDRFWQRIADSGIY